MNGDGRMDYTNGDYYTGDWEDGQQKGLGTMHYKNGNKFEGLWLNGLKEGPGRYFYAATQKVYEGEWSDGNPRCGEYREPSPEEMARFGASPLRTQTFSLPALGLDNPRGVLDLSMSSVRLENASKRGMVTREIFTQQDLQAAAEIYSQLDARGLGVLPWFKTGEVFRALGKTIHVLHLLLVFIFV